MCKRKGQLFVISAPSGAGKTTLCNLLLEEFDNVGYSISYTTRKPRSHETNGVEYHFVSKPKFEEMILAGEFIEHALVHDNYYGTAKRYIDTYLSQGKDILLDIDIQGAMQLQDKAVGAVYIFISVPSLDILRARLETRNDTPEIDIRLRNAKKEMQYLPRYDYMIINNALDEAYCKFKAIYKAEISKTCLIKDISTLI